jgi:hypothetical protein
MTIQKEYNVPSEDVKKSLQLFPLSDFLVVDIKDNFVLF